MTELNWHYIANLSGLSDLFDGLEPSFISSLTVLDIVRNKKIDERLVKLVVLLLANGVISKKELDSAQVNAVVKYLLNDGILREDGGLLSTRGLVLNKYRGVWFFVEQYSVCSQAYFGPDSIALAKRLVPSSGKKALDVCSGTGIQSLILAKCGMQVTSIELNRNIEHIYEFNAKINNVSDAVKLVIKEAGSYLASCSEKFDYVVSNPPLVPIPKQIPYPLTGDGGLYGIDITLKIINSLPKILNIWGEALILGLTPSYLPTLYEEHPLIKNLKRIGLTCIISILSVEELSFTSDYIQSVSVSSYRYDSTQFISGADCSNQLYKAFKDENLKYVVQFTLRIINDKDTSNILIYDHSGKSKQTRLWMI